MKQVTKLNPGETLPFVGEALRQVAAEVGNSAAVLGFVGAPFTLATYIVEVRGGGGEGGEVAEALFLCGGRKWGCGGHKFLQRIH